MRISQFFLFLFAAFCVATNTTAKALATDTVQISSKLKNNDIKLINTETPIIIQKGEILKLKIDNSETIPTSVRIHSSLGRLVKEFMQVDKQINVTTDKLLPGVYLIIIKQDKVREVKKFLLTE